MRRICDPDFVYRPWSDARRRAASERAIARLGAKPGHRLVYGINVPIRHWQFVAREAQRFRHSGQSLRETRRYVRLLVNSILGDRQNPTAPD